MRMVYCRFRLEGFHNWPDAPGMVSFLRDNHRHEFHFTISVEVTDMNREIEFITMKNHIISLIHGMYSHDISSAIIFEHRSCEMIANEILNKMESIDLYKILFTDEETGAVAKRQIIVEVSEDGENGGIVTRL
jgi:hypothetical protein